MTTVKQIQEGNMWKQRNAGRVQVQALIQVQVAGKQRRKATFMMRPSEIYCGE